MSREYLKAKLSRTSKSRPSLAFPCLIRTFLIFMRVYSFALHPFC
jgi:hypothetical protein